MDKHCWAFGMENDNFLTLSWSELIITLLKWLVQQWTITEQSLYCIVLYCIWTLVIAPLTRLPIQRRSRLLRGRWIGVSRRSAWAIASEGLAQGPYAAALRWIRTRNPPAARHRTYPYTTAPQLYCVVLYCIVLYSTFILRPSHPQ